MAVVPASTSSPKSADTSPWSSAATAANPARTTGS